MPIRFDDYLSKLPEERRRAIKERTAELIAEEATLRQLREARRRSQEEVAKKLHIKQAAVSKLERRADMYLSTLARVYRGDGWEPGDHRPLSRPDRGDHSIRVARPGEWCSVTRGPDRVAEESMIPHVN